MPLGKTPHRIGKGEESVARAFQSPALDEKKTSLSTPSMVSATHESPFWYDEPRSHVLSSQLRAIRPSSLAIAIIAAVALAVGLAVNTTIVPGQYEWLGLFRIFWDVSHRTGFWVLCFLVWIAGAFNAPAERRLDFSVAARRLTRYRVWWGLAAVFPVLVFASRRLLKIGTFADTLSFSMLVPGMIVHAIGTTARQGDRLREFGRLLLAALVALAAYTLIGYGHTMVKGALFVVAQPSDYLLQAADQRILGSMFYEQLATFRVGHPSTTRALDIVYIALLQQLWWSFFYFYGAQDIGKARPYVVAMFLLYTVGPLVYFAAPSRGPVFASPHLFQDLATLAPDSRSLARFLTHQTAMTEAGIAHDIAPFGFIAAMPSLHVGLSVTMLLAMKHSFAMALLNGGMLLLTILATTLLGWHYFVDDIVGAVLGLGCWVLAVSICKRDVITSVLAPDVSIAPR